MDNVIRKFLDVCKNEELKTEMYWIIIYFF